ncbi:MAG: rhomboid family intramembrane serine protease [Solirubrobacterales bacterium]|nr:rhomboid family intramembrane serine protease [Solirubrobacterales bacterium]
MLPLRDNIPTSRLPVVTIALIAINVLFFIWQLTFSTDPELDQVGYSAIDQSSIEYGAIPYRITHPAEADTCEIGAINSNAEPGIVCEGAPGFEQAEARGEKDPSLAPIPLDQAPWWLTLFTSMFMAGGFLHIAGNMLFLWVFGNNIEDAMGRGRFIAFYLLAGLVASYSQAALEVTSTAPTIGASGAVAGVLGAYALLYPRAKVLTLLIIILFVTLVEVPAMALLAIWFILQFIPAIGEVAVESGGGAGIAYFAHVGGFIFGLAAIRLFVRGRRDPPQPTLAA